jgi:hypothetical protein
MQISSCVEKSIYVTGLPEIQTKKVLYVLMLLLNLNLCSSKNKKGPGRNLLAKNALVMNED